MAPSLYHMWMQRDNPLFFFIDSFPTEVTPLNFCADLRAAHEGHKSQRGPSIRTAKLIVEPKPKRL